MTVHKFVAAAAAVALSCNAAPALAADLAFSGSVTGISTGGPDASCAPLPFRTMIAPATTVGTSSLGDFSYSSNICQGGGPVEGTFAIDFVNGSISGTQVGTATPTSTAGLFNLLLNYNILEGTGDFLGATGSFMGVGTADSRTPPTQVSLALNGTIHAPAVPESATWALMLLGFCGVGMALRRSRTPSIQQVL